MRESLAAKDVDKTIRTVVAGAVRLMNAEFGALFQCDSAGQLKLRSVSEMAGLSVESQSYFQELRSRIEREGVVALDINGELLQIRTFMGVPLRVGDGTVGLLALANRQGGFAEAERDSVALLAQFLAMAIAVSEAETKERLAGEKVMRAQRMDAIGVLAEGIAHEFNNILSPILGFSQLLMEDLPPGSGPAEFAEEISVAAKRAKSLVSRLLTA